MGILGLKGLKTNWRERTAKKKETKKQNKRKAVLHLTLSIATIVFFAKYRKIPKISPSMYKPFQI